MPYRCLVVSLFVLLWCPRLALRASAQAPAPASAPAPGQTADLAVRLATMTAVTGFEGSMVDSIIVLLPGTVRDRAGNATLTIGRGEPRRLVACALDEPGYIVGGIRSDGYLTLRRVGGQPPSPLYDQQLEGHRITVNGRKGPVPGVVAVRSIHLTRFRPEPSDEPFRVDDVVVDVGAASSSAAAALGVGVLAPVTLTKRPHRYGADLLAAPVAGRRAACAALLVAARRAIAEQGMVPRLGTTVIAFVVGSGLSNGGLRALANTAGPFRQTRLVGSRAGEPGALSVVPDSTAADSTAADSAADSLPAASEAADTALQTQAPGLGDAVRWTLDVRYADSAVETVSLADATALQARLEAWLASGR